MQRLQKRRTYKKRNYPAKLAITAIIFGLVIIAGVIYYITSTPKPKKPANEYFDITNIFVLARNISDGLKIFMVSFNLTAVEGDAHNVYISIDGLKTQDPTQKVLLIGNLKKGESYALQEVQLTGYVTHLKDSLGYPFTIKVYSSETDPDKPEINVTISPKDVIILPY